MTKTKIDPQPEYLTPKQASEIYPFSPSYFTRNAERFGGIRVGGGDHRAGRWLFTRAGIESSFKKLGRMQVRNAA